MKRFDPETWWAPVAAGTRRVLEALDRPVGRSSDPKHPRGVALLLALVTIAMTSAIVIEFAYETRVNLAMASNERDRLKSYYLARSSINLSQLLLSLQSALQEESKETDDELGRLIGRAMRRSNFQMYQYVDLLMKPFHSGKLETPVGGVDLGDSGVEGFGDFVGEFTAEVEPEVGKINLNEFANKQLDPKHIMQLCALFADPQYDELFSLKDAYGDVMSRQVVIQNIVDFIDPDQEATTINEDCGVQGVGGDESRAYSRDDTYNISPRNASLTHVDDLYQVHGIGPEFMERFGSSFTVYNVGKPNINVAQAPVFYAVLCQNVQVGAASGYALCARDPGVAAQVLLIALALDGIRAFFEDPMSVLLAYVGSNESRLLPSAKKGQPVAFLNTGQLPQFIDDLMGRGSSPNPTAAANLMVQFIQYSPLYQQMVLSNPTAAIDPLNPQFPQWTVSFDGGGLARDVSTQTPQIYRIVGLGRYGTTETRIEAVIDFGKTLRRLPDEQQLLEDVTDSEETATIKEALRETREQMPKGRVLYWQE